MKKIIKNVAFYVLFSAAVAIFLAIVMFLVMFSRLAQYFFPVFCAITLLSIVAMVIVKIKKHISLPLMLLATLAITIAVNSITAVGTLLYLTEYSRWKWDHVPRDLRIYMLNDLKKEFDFIGKTEEEIINFLGEPGAKPEYGDRKYFEYHIGDDFIDSITFDIVFIDGKSVETRKSVH